MDLNVPDRCLVCPVIVKGIAHINEYEQENDGIIRYTTSSALEETVPEFFDRQLDQSSSLLSGATSEEVINNIRAIEGKRVEINNSRIDTVKTDLATHALGCMGALILEGSPTNEELYTVITCTSDAVQQSGITEEVIVMRTPIPLEPPEVIASERE